MHEYDVLCMTEIVPQVTMCYAWLMTEHALKTSVWQR